MGKFPIQLWLYGMSLGVIGRGLQYSVPAASQELANYDICYNNDNLSDTEQMGASEPQPVRT